MSRLRKNNSDWINVDIDSFKEKKSKKMEENIEQPVEEKNIKEEEKILPDNEPKKVQEVETQTQTLNDTHNETNEIKREKSILYIVFDFSRSIIKNIFKILWNFISGIFKIACIYLVWIFMHYWSSHLYTTFCVPNNWYGFLMSPFLTATPHCQGLRWIVYNGANTINTMWILIGTWLSSKFIFTTSNPDYNMDYN